jgi:hypothetical protein
MAQGTTLVLPFTERLPSGHASDPPRLPPSVPPHLTIGADASASWPRFGEFRWLGLGLGLGPLVRARVRVRVNRALTLALALTRRAPLAAARERRA